MSQLDNRRGEAELRAARADQRGLLWAVGIFSIFANILQLTGSLYMLQVYDRVLGSRSEATLVALSVLVTFLFLAMGILDNARARVMARIGAKMQDRLDRRVFSAAMRRLTLQPNEPTAVAAQRDLEAIQRLWASPVLLAIFDIPWTPIFIAAIFIFHPYLGWLAVAGGIFLIIVTVLNQRMTLAPLNRTNNLTMVAERMSDMIKSESETVQALGMTGAAFDRWQKARGAALAESIAAGDLAGSFGGISKTFRVFLQSAMLGLGAWLVLKGELSAGAMIAGSILLGRALQPIEQAVGQWAVVTRAQEANRRLSDLLSRMPEEPTRTALPKPKAVLEAQNLTVIPPGEMQAVLRAVSFRIEPGQAMGVIGPSGAGKSTLARALIGVWKPAGGKVRLDGATLDQYDPDILGSYIGYLPQRITLFDGTIAENIARLHSGADPAQIVDAAKRAAAHDMIIKLPEGYDTRISQIGGRLSGGQIQRIGLARALYGNPVILVLDEPNSNLDNDGTIALNTAIRTTKEAGGAVLIMAHRPAAIQECELLLVLEDGMRRAFGPRDAVLREMVKNHNQITQATTPGGVS
ncbi:MAG: ATP-binding cassette subfamily C bacterial [Rhodobacteraceae bacterium]|uniref:type I secretion system permease/ATPase n=1 Tax=Cypionkella sp. TaxID=2811411 RepID=UPI001325A9F3|nr:type I secretion system permease/ATPase [Cypionkella sp.]KAF0176168.1 MAG: ATP-binding cassette subfamily C bacterial [Paracoccaceae bacterium]MDO8328662.1 type I secretion system permease/ATPase [Cypionkella sp.]